MAYMKETISSQVSVAFTSLVAGASLDQGAHLTGYFTSIQLQNGACIAYKI